ncbi:MAG: hypothetical protein WCZ17_06820, partial [Candidatus Kapaibacterium sp.]
ILGLGDINYGSNAAYNALGNTQIAFPAENSINSRNPAMWSFVTSTRLQAGYKFNQNIVSTENNTLWHNNGSISGFSGIFAIDSANGVSASFGIVPYSNINYLTAVSADVEQSGMELTGTTTYQGKGGISQAYAGASAKITEFLGVGASLAASFGVMESLRETEFLNDYYAFKYTTSRNDYISGWGLKTGMFTNPVKNLIIGISYELQPKLSITRETNYNSPTIPDTVLSNEFDVEIPALFGIGASFATGNFIIGADFSMQDFTGFDYNLGSNTEFSNSYFASVGVNRIGNPSINAPFADRVAYKFGLSYNNLYYKVLNNQISEYAASIGMQMPFHGSLIVDLSFVVGQRIAGDSRLVDEYFGRFGVDISIGETWFVPFKREF